MSHRWRDKAADTDTFAAPDTDTDANAAQM